MFKRKKGSSLTYNQQGLIYFLSVNFSILPEALQSVIQTVCEDIGGVYSSALFTYLTNPYIEFNVICRNDNIPARKLMSLRNSAYEEIYRKIKHLWRYGVTVL